MVKNYLQKRFINLLVRNLFNTIDEDDILLARKDGVYLRGKKMDRMSLDVLREEAERFRGSSLWKLLSREIKYQSNLRMFEKGITTDDILAGKLALYILEIIKKTIDRIARF